MSRHLLRAQIALKEMTMLTAGNYFDGNVRGRHWYILIPDGPVPPTSTVFSLQPPRKRFAHTGTNPLPESP